MSIKVEHQRALSNLWHSIDSATGEFILITSDKVTEDIKVQVESTTATMISAGLSLLIKAAIDQEIPLYQLNELVTSFYEQEVRK